MDGFELYERLKKIDPSIEACFLTSSEMYHQKIRANIDRRSGKAWLILFLVELVTTLQV
jgi:CheY-like chemotaxis protein